MRLWLHAILLLSVFMVGGCGSSGAPTSPEQPEQGEGSFVFWEDYVVGSSYSYASSILKTYEKNYLIVGGVSGDPEKHLAPDLNLNGFVVKLSEEGVRGFFRNIGERGLNSLYDIHEISPGKYVAVGVVHLSDGSVDNSSLPNKAYVVGLDEEGGKTWDFALENTVWSWFNKIKKSPEGCFFVAGTGIKSGRTDTDFMLCKFADDGTLLWNKTIGGSYNDMVWGLDVNFDGSLIISGVTLSYDGDLKNIDGDGHGWLLKLDKNGKIMWQTRIGDKGQWLIASSVEATSRGSYVVCGSFSKGMDILNPDIKNLEGHYGWMAEIDQDGNVIWMKILNEKPLICTNLVAVKQDLDGNYVAVGGQWLVEDMTSLSPEDLFGLSINDHWDGLVVKISPEGELKWNKVISRDYGNGFSDFLIEPDGYALVGSSNVKYAGSYPDNVSFTSNAWILKIKR